MRLINAKTLELEVYNDASRRPRYAILSHRWVDGHEVTFEDMQRAHRHFMPAWPKITSCCQQALADDLEYVWVDTCCIDKNSSAELSEAINSMYMWYSDAERCYAYLNDVGDVCHGLSDPPSTDSSTMTSRVAHDIVASKWFTRAWTLQELIAPREVVFYDATFQRLGSKVDFADMIERAIMIPAKILLDPLCLSKYPVAVRMSWAANREASRTEDIAYSLFGIFGVNLPLLYGEGKRAYLRLQEEIIKQTYDHSIFAWSAQKSRKRKQEGDQTTGKLPLLASSPKDFEDCKDVSTSESNDEMRPYNMTNIGLQIELRIFPYDMNIYVGLLSCQSTLTSCRYGILLIKDSGQSRQWHRAHAAGIDRVAITRPEKLKYFVWQEMFIVKYNSTAYGKATCERSRNSGRSLTEFYGMNIDAPDFLVSSTGIGRPYALVAYHDWEVASEDIGVNEDSHVPKLETQNPQNEFTIGKHKDTSFTTRMPGYIYNANNLLNESSHIGLAMSIDQTILLSGFRRSKRRKLNDSASSRPQKEADQVRKRKSSKSNLALGVLPMPLMCTGTVGLIVFDHIVYGIRAIKVGFDFEFRPVIFLATHEAVPPDPQIQTLMQQHRYVPLEYFQRSYGLLESFNEGDHQQFWKLGPEYLKNCKNAVDDDGFVPIDTGVYAFTCRDAAVPDHWIFKPYDDQNWHIALRLERREYDDLRYWELSMEIQEDLVKIVIEEY